MGTESLWHWIIVIGVVLLLFGRGKVSELMTDVAHGVKSFKKAMSDEQPAAAQPPAVEAPKDRPAAPMHSSEA